MDEALSPRPARGAFPRTAMLAAAALLAACGGTSTSDPVAPVIASFTASPASVAPGGSSTLSWSVSGATSLSIDGGVGTVTGTSVPVTPGATTTYTLTAVNAAGSTLSAPVTVTVAVGPPALEVACSGAGCGATSASQYAGSGIGIWRYRNATGAPVTIDVAIGGVADGLKPVLLFSNGSGSATTLPSPLATPAVALLQPPMSSEADLRREARDRAHAQVTERNWRSALALRDLVPTETSPGATALAAPLAPPPISTFGGTYTWMDMEEIKKEGDPKVIRDHPSTVRGICNLSTGRKAAFWVANDAWNVNVADSDLGAFMPVVCGTDKGYEMLKTMIGDAWGDKASPLPVDLIQDTPSLQDIHIVFANLPDANLAGYFWSCNNYRKGKAPSNCPDTNEALVVFINAALVKTDQAGQASTVMHEMTHLVNFYQRTLTTRSPYATWLEEMSAMMTEDIVVPAVTAGRINDIPTGRVEPYLKNAGGVSLMNWDGDKSYNLGATFGAFLSRRYGTAIYAGMKTCPVGADPDVGTSYACLEKLIVDNGGESLADDFARTGATIYGLLPATGAPEKYGMPAKAIGTAFTLGAIDVPAYRDGRKAVATPLGNTFLATTHSYKLDAAASGTYSRPGVVVPAGTTLMVVIQP